MSKNWSYAGMSKTAKEVGGPEKYARMLQKYGFQKGVAVMVPVCVLGCGITYKKGTQIVNFFKERFGFVTDADAEYARARLEEIEEELVVQCPNCGRTAYGIDEINVIFGFEKNESGGIEPNTKCKRCCTN